MVCFFYALAVNLCVDQNFSSLVSGCYSNLHSIAIHSIERLHCTLFYLDKLGVLIRPLLVFKAGNQGFARTQALMQLLNKPVLTELSMAGGKLEFLILCIYGSGN
jgi:hypothetical protein